MTSASRAPAPVCAHTRRPYEERAARYSVAADRLAAGGLCDLHVVADIGAGGTELDYMLRAERGWRGRYVPVDRWTGPVVDVLALDPTHRTPVTRQQLADAGLYTSVHNFYGTDGDGICGVWYRVGLDVLERSMTIPVYSRGTPHDQGEVRKRSWRCRPPA
jgi:hypothetical protein